MSWLVINRFTRRGQVQTRFGSTQWKRMGMSLRRNFIGLVLLALFFSMNFGVTAEEAIEEQPEAAEEEIAEKIEAARGRIELIDERMAALDEERERLNHEAREAQRERFEVRRRVTEDDENVQALLDRQEELQRELHEVRGELGRYMAEHPDYVAQQERQQNVMTRFQEMNAETSKLSTERVEVQLEVQALERRLHEKRGETDESAEQDQHYSLEVPDDI